jgi:hypothetical protein
VKQGWANPPARAEMRQAQRKMETKLFWKLMEDICQLGEFIAGIETNGAEINIVGTFRVFHDGIELVLENQDCGDHFHLAAERIKAIHFGYYDVTTGEQDPCIELVNVDDQVCMRLFYYPYQEKELKPKYEQFVGQHEPYGDYPTGES